jgi:hypothetical protein
MPLEFKRGYKQATAGGQSALLPRVNSELERKLEVTRRFTSQARRSSRAIYRDLARSGDARWGNCIREGG